MTQVLGEAPPGTPLPGPATTAPEPDRRPVRVGPAPRAAEGRRPWWRRLGAGWPLAAMLLGWPVWWLLGLAETVPLLVALVMAVQLLRQPVVHLPRGFGWWALFLVWVVLGAAMLWVDAPGAVPGGGGPGRLAVFGFKLSWYVACTVALVWICTMPRKAVPDRLVHGSVAWMFLVSTVGGLLALAVPTLELVTPFERVLPPQVAGNTFVQSLVHLQVADVQTVLGTEGTRPKAPFAYTNTWGSVMAMSLVFVGGWLARARGRSRVCWSLVALVAVAAALPPVLYSLNRGLWGALALGGVGLAVLAAAKGRPALLVACGVLAGIGLLTVLATPLGELVTDRMDNQHSNDRRGGLLTLTTESVSQGSPVLGFGGTRDVQGSFASITGGSTPDCPGCGVPPLGTQGLLWMVLFSQGWPGLAFFLLFVLLALVRAWRCRTVNEAVCTFAIAFFLLQLPVYDTLGLPLMVLMLAIGLVARERRETEGSGPPRLLTTLPRLVAEVRRGLPVLVATSAAGAVVGLVLALLAPAPDHVARVFLAITPAPVYLETEVDTAEEVDALRRPPQEITVDTEAALLMSETTLEAAARSVDSTPRQLRAGLGVTGQPNSSVLVMHVRWPDPDEIPGLATAVSSSYLETREEYLEQRREDVVAQLREELRELQGTSAPIAEREALTDAITQLETDRRAVGEVVRTVDPEPGRRDYELLTVSSAAVGLLVGVILVTLVPPRPRGPARPGERPGSRTTLARRRRD
ncbi:hypothetical protein [Nocardioides solisilvae]|uniref:hypothetical protein n=1 Tax=Nocardioides solisilvae TaxID=1542435 RepID=UPI0013A5A526|nr:hypothetical protein [Nocardioides solisilvae]